MMQTEAEALKQRIRLRAGQLLRALGPALMRLTPTERAQLQQVPPLVWMGLALLVSSWPYADVTRLLLGEWGDKVQPMYGAIAPLMRSHLSKAVALVVSGEPAAAATGLSATLRSIGIPMLALVGQYDSTARLASALVGQLAPLQSLPDYEG